MAELHNDTSDLLTLLRLAHLNGWRWNLKTRDLTMMNTSDRETMMKISPLMAADTATVPDYPQILIDRGIIQGSAVDLVNEYTLMIYHADNGQEVCFRLPFTTKAGDTVWLQFRGAVYRDENGDPDHAVGYYTDITAHLDSARRGELEDLMSMEQEKQRCMNIIKGLTLEYANVFLINLTDESFSVFRLNALSEHMVRGQMERCRTFREVVSYYIQEYVVPEDRERLQCLTDPKQIRTMLREKGYCNMSYRSFRDGELVYCQVKIAQGNVADDEVVLGFRNVDEEYRERQQLERRSRQDALTGLLNRTAFHNDVLRELYGDNAESTAFLFIDLDHFKQVNDTLGHTAGDLAISNAADALRSIFRKNDVLGRYGGDEFCVLLRNIPPEMLKTRLDQCLEKLHAVYTKGSARVEVTASIGVAYYVGSCRADATRLTEQADAALYAAKRGGRNRYEIYRYDTN